MLALAGVNDTRLMKQPKPKTAPQKSARKKNEVSGPLVESNAMLRYAQWNRAETGPIALAIR
ncbi:MAG: hypothetical protein CMJ48_13345 [Planctomycetaceae bacterium]|nr:hypothetical protein [Planctomycetaceae bacterium]